MVSPLVTRVALVALTLMAGPAGGETVVHEAGGVELSIPDDWTQEHDDEVLLIADPAEEIAVVLVIVDAEALDAAQAALDQALAAFIARAEVVGQPETASFNGLSAVVTDGRGLLEGAPVDWGVALVEVPSGKVLMLLALAGSAAMKNHEVELDQIVASLRPIGTPAPPPVVLDGPVPPPAAEAPVSPPVMAPVPPPVVDPAPPPIDQPVPPPIDQPVPPPGETMVHEAAGVEVWLPTAWTRETDDDVLYVSPTTEDAVVVLWVMDAESIEDALTSMDGELTQIIPDLEASGEAQTGEIHGMPLVALDGNGTMEGTPVDVSVAVVLSPRGKVLLVLAVAETANLAHYEAIFEQIVTSLAPVP